MRRPALRIVFAPLFKRDKAERENGTFQRGYVRVPTPGASREGTRTIYLDPRCSNIGKTFLHERLHIEHPKWSERQVDSETRRRWEALTWKEAAEIYRLIGKARLEGEA